MEGGQGSRVFYQIGGRVRMRAASVWRAFNAADAAEVPGGGHDGAPFGFNIGPGMAE
jgi:hypothetical protein